MSRRALAWTFLLLAQAVAAQTPAALPEAAPPPAPPGATPADADDDGSYVIDVWGQARFGADGRIESFDVPDADSYPVVFVQQLKARFAQARIAPARGGDGQPATFDTGVVMHVRVSPAAAGGQPTARVSGIAMAPRPVKRYAASHPAGVPMDHTLRVAMVCTVDIEGQCRDPRIDGQTFQLPSFRRWAVESLRSWRFVPQRVGDDAVEGEFRQVLLLETRRLRPDNFRSPNRTLDRALQR